MATQTPEQIREKVLTSLKGTPYAVSTLEPLSGGVGNFLYRAQLHKPLEDGTTIVAVKHGEGFIATSPNNELTLDRCKVEEECLKALVDFRVTGTQDSVRYTVRTPKCYFYDEKSNTQILEFLPNGIDLKNYILKNFSSPMPESRRAAFHELGKELAQWITGFHRISEEEAREALDADEKSRLYGELEKCEWMQKLKHRINYEWLMQRTDLFPDILEEARDVFEDFKKERHQELLRGDLMPIHGDFWTGNIVVPNVPIQAGADIPLFVIDWEMAQLGPRSMDYGQMLGEMYALWLYRKLDAGLWMVQGFSEALALQNIDAAFRVAAQVGCHLVSFDSVVPGWGTPEQARAVARMGRDLIVHAQARDRRWFDQSEMAGLFSSIGRT